LRLSALRAHTKMPYETDFLWEMLKALNRPGWARTGKKNCPNCCIATCAASGTSPSVPGPGRHRHATPQALGCCRRPLRRDSHTFESIQINFLKGQRKVLTLAAVVAAMFSQSDGAARAMARPPPLRVAPRTTRRPSSQRRPPAPSEAAAATCTQDATGVCQAREMQCRVQSCSAATEKAKWQ
jgi:hypothetical protein